MDDLDLPVHLWKIVWKYLVNESKKVNVGRFKKRGFLYRDIRTHEWYSTYGSSAKGYYQEVLMFDTHSHLFHEIRDERSAEYWEKRLLEERRVK